MRHGHPDERAIVRPVLRDSVTGIMTHGDERIGSDVPLAHGDLQPERAYAFEERPGAGGALGG